MVVILENLEKRIENIENDIEKMKKFLGKWLPKFWNEWRRLKNNSIINMRMTMEQINIESKYIVDVFNKYSDLDDRIKKLESSIKC